MKATLNSLINPALNPTLSSSVLSSPKGVQRSTPARNTGSTVSRPRTIARSVTKAKDLDRVGGTELDNTNGTVLAKPRFTKRFMRIFAHEIVTSDFPTPMAARCGDEICIFARSGEENKIETLLASLMKLGGAATVVDVDGRQTTQFRASDSAPFEILATGPAEPLGDLTPDEVCHVTTSNTTTSPTANKGCAL